MTRGELEAKVWAITGRAMTGEQVDAILDVAVAYAAGLNDRSTVRSSELALTPHGAELYPVISVLARALLGDEAGATVHELRRGAA